MSDRRGRRRLRAPAALLIAVLAFALVSPVQGCGDDNEPPADVKAVTLGVSREVLSALAYIARDHGIFPEHGLDVTFAEYSSSQLALEALLSGEVDVALCADTPIVLAALTGDPVRIIVTAAADQSDIYVVARASAGISSPRDLKGKRVGTREGTAAHFFLHGFLISNGMSERDVDVRFDSFEGVTAALIAGELDAVSLRQPFISELQVALGDDYVLFEEEGLYEKTMNLCVAPDDPPEAEVQRRLVRALLQAENLGASDPTGAIEDEVAIAIGAAPGDLCECVVVDGAVSLRQSLLLTLEDQARWARADGIVPDGAYVDFLSMLDPTVLDAVAPDRVTVIR